MYIRGKVLASSYLSLFNRSRSFFVSFYFIWVYIHIFADIIRLFCFLFFCISACISLRGQGAVLWNAEHDSVALSADHGFVAFQKGKQKWISPLNTTGGHNGPPPPHRYFSFGATKSRRWRTSFFFLCCSTARISFRPNQFNRRQV